MTKHPHKLILMNKKTWKCVLEGCNFFVHLGLAHVVTGKSAVCWDCGEIFTIDEYALREEMPRCTECRMNRVIEPIVTEEVQEMTPEKKAMYKSLGWIK